MEKRYQVFVSSTYADLKDERSRVIQTLMELDCIPAGMELFPAMDEEQLEFIKRVIDDCDYYILIIGGRYGSTTPEGISYTEKEYDYAIERKIKVLAFLHEKPGEISVEKSDIDPELRSRLNNFREKVSQGRLVKFWTKAEELPSVVALSLNKTIKTYPAIGWVRANQIANVEALGELNELRKRNEELEKRVAELDEDKFYIEGLANLNEIIELTFNYYSDIYSTKLEISFGELFKLIAPELSKPNNDNDIKTFLEGFFSRIINYKSYKFTSEYYDNDHGKLSLNRNNFLTAKFQFIALGLITLDSNTFWRLTQKGENTLLQIHTVKSSTR